VVQAGTYYVRARAVNSTYVAGGGGASGSQSVDVIEDVVSGPDPSNPAYQGFMDGLGPYTVSDLNILPVDDEDWFSADVCELDTLVVETFAQRLAEPSPLDTYLEVWDPTATTIIAENDDIDFDAGNLDSYVETAVPSDGEYLITVFSVNSNSAGSYELTIDVKRGPNNDGAQCTTGPGAVADVVVTPAGASIVAAGGTQPFAAGAFDDQGNPIVGATFTWTSLNPSIATVDASGLVTAVANGQVIISAETDGVAGYAVATVTVPGTTQANLWANFAGFGAHGWGTSESDIWVCSAVDEMSHWNGSAWTAFPVTMPGCREIWGSASDDVFVSGIDGNMIHWNGSQWTSMNTGTVENLVGLWGSAPDDVWTVGTNGTILHFDGSNWTPEASVPTTELLRRVWGTADDNVYVAATAGTVLRYDGASWSLVAGVPTSEQLNAMWGSGPTDIFLGGDHGAVVRFDGAWSSMTTPTTDSLRGFGGASSSDLYAVGFHGNLWRFNGSSWDVLANLTPNPLWDAWASPGGDMYAFGNDGMFRGYRGATLAISAPTTTLTALDDQVQLTAEARDAGNNPISGVTFTWSSDVPGVATVDQTGLVTAVADGIANIWAIAPGGARAVQPITVQQVAATVSVSPDPVLLSGVGAMQAYVVSAEDANGNPIPSPSANWSSLNPFVATINSATGLATAERDGEATITVEIDGVRGYAVLKVIDPGATAVNVLGHMNNPVTVSQLLGVWGASEDDVFMGGDAGIILHFDGTSWSQMSNPSSVQVWDFWGTSGSDVFAVGGGGIVHYDGVQWSTMTTPATSLRGVWGAAPNDVFAVGTGGSIVHYNGTDWIPQNSGTTEDLYAVWGSAGSDVYAVGDNGTILQHDGTGWATMTTPTAVVLTGIWGTLNNDIYAVGGSGTILRYDGSTWGTMTSPTGSLLRAVWGTDFSDDLYAVGLGGTVIHYNGVSWTNLTTPTTAALTGLWGSATGDVIVSGQNGGQILRGMRGFQALALVNFDGDLAAVLDSFAVYIPDVPIDTLNVSGATPTQGFLGNYDVVLLWENGTYPNSASVGDAVATYVQNGGNAVLGTFYWQGRSDGGFGGSYGGLESIDPFISTGGSEYTADTLNVASIVAHPLTFNVTNLDVDSYHGGVTAKAGTSVLASWTTPGVPAIGYRTEPGNQRIVGVTTWPGYTYGGTWNGDYYRIWSNALRWAGAGGVAGPAPSPPAVSGLGDAMRSVPAVEVTTAASDGGSSNRRPRE
jgi:uncharacterized protein YjdB